MVKIIIFFLLINFSIVYAEQRENIEVTTFMPAPFGDYEFINTNSLNIANILSNPNKIAPANLSDYNFININKGFTTAISADILDYIEFNAETPEIKLSNPYINAGIKLESGANAEGGIVDFGINNNAWFSMDTQNKKFIWNWKQGSSQTKELMTINFNTTDNIWILNTSGDIKSAADINIGRNLLSVNKIGAGINKPASLISPMDPNSRLFISSGDVINNYSGAIFTTGNNSTYNDVVNITSGWKNITGIKNNSNNKLSFAISNLSGSWQDILTIKGDNNGNVKMGINETDPSEKLVIATGDTQVYSSALLFSSGKSVSGQTNTWPSFKIEAGSELNFIAAANYSAGTYTWSKILNISKNSNNIDIKITPDLTSSGIRLETDSIKLGDANLSSNKITNNTYGYLQFNTNNMEYYNGTASTFSRAMQIGQNLVYIDKNLYVHELINKPIEVFCAPSSGTLGDYSDLNLGYNSNDWVCFSAGFACYGADFNETGNWANPIFVNVFSANGTWYVNANLATHAGHHDSWRFHIVAIKRDFMELIANESHPIEGPWGGNIPDYGS